MQPAYTNNLINETSLYLRQHAHNPVAWHAWNDESLAKAKEQNKPILVSIGYAACHWCHVMERESFEDKATADLMNEYFINIKIDREERPDLDHIYMEAVQLISGSGGWPLNVFLTPDGKPFFGGTYFPPERAFNRMSWKEVLHSIHYNWAHNRKEILEQAQQLIEHISNGNNRLGELQANTINFLEQPKDGEELCKEIADNILKQADKTEGGFGKAPKFPQTFSLQYLLRYGFFTKNEEALTHAEFSIQKMMNGGINDQLGGGLCRYSTDAAWLVPHFEKMLYDNALWLQLLAEAYQQTKNEIYAEQIKKTFSFLQREMKDSQGGYYAAIDADSEGVEGKFYVWSLSEIKNVLGDDAGLYAAFYSVTEEGNWEENNILEVTNDLNGLLKKFELTNESLKNKIELLNSKLLAVRAKRIRPVTDDKILLGWNALLLKAFATCFAALQMEAFKTEAISLATFLDEKFNKDEKYFHTYTKGISKYPAFLDDLAYWIDGLIALQEITGDVKYLFRAKELTEEVIKNFTQPDQPYFYFTNVKQTDVIVRKIELYDAATASPNAVMLHNLLYLSIIFEEDKYYNQAIKMLQGVKEIVKKYPNSFAVWAAALAKLSFPQQEIVIAGKNYSVMLNNILPIFIPHKVLISNSSANNLPVLINKDFTTDTKLYVCRNRTCLEPVNTLKDFIKLINK